MKSKYYDWTKELIEQGLIYTEIAEIQGRDPHNVRKLCIATGLDKLIDRKDPIEKMAEQLQEKGYDLVSCTGGIDGIIRIRCKKCGGTIERKGQVARKPYRILCECCREKKKQEQKRQARIALERKRELIRIEHMNPRQTAMVECKCCGSMFVPLNAGYRYCSPECASKTKWMMKEGYRYRFPLMEVFKRDGGICYICGKPCDWNDYIVKDGAKIYGDAYPSRDHVVPKSRGGANDWNNIRLAHRICNSRKSTRPL